MFYSLGFDVVIHDNLTADDMRHKLKELSRRNYSNEDALVSNSTHFQSSIINDYCLYFIVHILTE